jgi:hypothetical protein
MVKSKIFFYFDQIIYKNIFFFFSVTLCEPLWISVLVLVFVTQRSTEKHRGPQRIKIPKSCRAESDKTLYLFIMFVQMIRKY